MRPLSLLLLILVLCAPGATAQDAEPPDGAPPEGAIIESVDVSGLSRDSLSPGLRRELETLTGEPLNRQRLGELAARIEGEHPDLVTAVRIVARPDGQARVIFLVARISDDGSLVENINTRYMVESVEIRGVPDSEISQPLRDRLQSLVGRRLDHDEAEELNERLEAERPGFDVTRRISRGSERGRIRVVFEFSEREGTRWIPFTASRSKFVYHSEQGWSGVLDIPMGNRNHRVTAGFAFDNNDDLIEEYSGVRFAFESRKLATDRLGARVEITNFNQTWKDATLLALAADQGLLRIPEPYRARLTVDPSVTFAMTPFVRVTGGASISELESLSHSPDSQMASALLARVDYDQRWYERRVTQRVQASYELQSATEALESDLLYTRHLGKVRYRYTQRRSTVIADLVFGGITGDAPLFERFTLGDSSTLRGWNKYDIAPAGGDRVFHTSLEYRYRALGLFFDSGSVWDSRSDMRIRLASGFGVQTDNAFVTLAFPLNADDLGVTFTMGVQVLTGWRVSLIALLLVTSTLRLFGQSITVRALGNELRIRAPGLAFIEGQMAERLQDGRAVRIDFELTVLEKSQGPTIARAQHSFNLSFDLWEQRFAVTRVGQTPRSISHLTKRAAEDWCLDNITVPLSALGRFAKDAAFWVRIEYRVQERASPGNAEESAFTLQTLIDVLSRKRENQEQGKSVEAGPFRLTN